MDEPRFDAWTRRRFGLAAGGLATALFASAGPDNTAAKKGKKRCKNLDQGCKPGGKKRKCCQNKGLQCRPNAAGRNRCCRKGGEPCSTASASECCSGTCTDQHCECRTVGAPCDVNQDCCSGNCNTGGDLHCLPA